MTNAAATSSYPPRAQAYYALTMLTVASFVSFLDRSILGLVVGPVEHDLGITDTQIGILQGFTFTIFFTVTAIPLGWLADKIVRRNLIIAGIALWSVMTILSGMAESYTQLLIARIGVAVGEATLIPASVSMLPDYFPPTQRGRAFGVLSLAAIVGSSGSYFVGGMLLRALKGYDVISFPLLGDLVIWQATFVFVGLPGLLLALLMLTVREPPRLGLARPDGETPAEAAAGKESFVHYVKRHPKAFLYVWGMYTMTTYVAYCLIPWGPTVMFRKFGVAMGDAGMTIGIASSVLGVIACLLTGHLGDRMTAKGLRGGRFRITTLWSFGILPSVLLFTLGTSFEMSLFGYAFGTFFNSLTFGSAYAVMQEIVPARMRGRATASWYLCNALLANGLGPLASALATQHIFGTPSALPLGILVATMPGILLGFVFPWIGMTPFERARREAIGAPMTSP